jgi:hypothetical protein
MAGGRPPKYTPERLKGILESISHRIPYELAAEANGISEVTLYDWINTGRADSDNGIDSVLAQFSKDIKRIEEKRMYGHLNKLKKNVKNWQADAWILERRWHKYFGSSVPLKELDERIKKMEAMASKDKDKDNG